METSFRSKLIALLTFIGGLYFFLAFILPENVLKALGIAELQDDIALGFVSIGLVTFGLGIFNLLMIHGGKIVYRKRGWVPSAALLAGLFLMLGFSVYDWTCDVKIQKQSQDLATLLEFSRVIAADAQTGKEGVPALSVRSKILIDETKATIDKNLLSLHTTPAFRTNDLQTRYLKQAEGFRYSLQLFAQKANDLQLQDAESVAALSPILAELASQKRELLSLVAEDSLGKKMYQLLFQGLFVSLGSALFSLLGVYIAAAAYRAFRIKTFESSLMMAAALLVMLGQISFGTWIYAGMPEIRAWLLEVPNSAASRAISIGAAVAGLVLAFRMWFSIETNSFANTKDKK